MMHTEAMPEGGTELVVSSVRFDYPKAPATFMIKSTSFFLSFLGNHPLPMLNPFGSRGVDLIFRGRHVT